MLPMRRPNLSAFDLWHMPHDPPKPDIETPVVSLDECGSTNIEAMQLGLRGEAGPLWVLARRQSKGRGRAGRSWAGEEGNLLASFLMRLHCPVQAAAQLSLVAGLAAAHAIARCAGDGCEIPLWLKWPNDIMIGRAKVGGILVETSTLPATSQIIAVVGFGVNLASAPQVSNRIVGNLRAFDCDIEPRAMLGLLDRELTSTLGRWSEGSGFDKIRRDWLRLTVETGTWVSVTTASGGIRGRFAGLNSEGHLLISDESGKTHCVTYGDVEVLSGASGAGEGSSIDNKND